MPSSSDRRQRPVDITALLEAWNQGDLEARDQLIPAVYEELGRRAAAFLRRERAGQTLQPTALVHEAFLKIFGDHVPAFDNREHFMAVAASAMRTILVDHARARAAVKRGGNHARVPLDDLLIPFEESAYDILALDEALGRLKRFSEQAARVVELRFFGGLEQADAARVIGVSVSTVERDWRMARAWLRRELSADKSGGAG